MKEESKLRDMYEPAVVFMLILTVITGIISAIGFAVWM